MKRLTLEQQEIVYCEADNIYVNAKAGTGKTTTLVEFVKLRKKNKFLYIVYNNAIKNEALSKFPEYVVIHTIHSLAYKSIGVLYKDKISNSQIKIEDIFYNLPYFKDKKIEDRSTNKIITNIIKTINEYCNSDKINIEGIANIKLIEQLALDYWNQMINVSNLNVKITHDGYLKLYHLQKDILDFDYIMIDEAQDSNEVMLDIVYNQKAKKIFVGDPHQKIYGFRGALNVFDNPIYISRGINNEFLTLTKSFRFGKPIADIANKLLTEFKEERENLLTGTEDRDSMIYENIDKEMQYTIITRTNAKLIDIAIEKVKKGDKIFINGGADFIFNQVLDAYYLYKGELEKIKSDYIKSLKKYGHLKAIANSIKSPENMLQVYLIEKYGDPLLQWIDLIKANMVSKKSANVLLTTAHKSKGLEFVSVLLSNDFTPLYNKYGKKFNKIQQEELNLIYVAITRATHDLELNNDLKKLLYK